tara:strand:- start:124 stop:867 length:744 start_codon:yes stop_codon:yes gene_type:complete
VKTLERICEDNKTDKFQHGYCPVYDKYFNKYRDQEINFVEIGVFEGNSIRAWLEYFPKAQIFALDVYEKSHLFNDPRIHFFHMDASQEDCINNLMAEIAKITNRKKIDLLVDDGSHFQYDQMNSLGYIFPFIESAGIYAIEDIVYERDLKSGSQWWGHSGEPHHSVAGECHLGSQIRTDKEWLAGDEINYENCTDATLGRFLENKTLDSRYLTKSQNQYISKNTKHISIYDDSTLTCPSKLCFISKK